MSEIRNDEVGIFLAGENLARKFRLFLYVLGSQCRCEVSCVD